MAILMIWSQATGYHQSNKLTSVPNKFGRMYNELLSSFGIQSLSRRIKSLIHSRYSSPSISYYCSGPKCITLLIIIILWQLQEGNQPQLFYSISSYSPLDGTAVFCHPLHNKPSYLHIAMYKHAYNIHLHDINIAIYLTPIVEGNTSWRKSNVTIRYNSWWLPPSFLCPLTDQHVIRKMNSKWNFFWSHLFMNLWSRFACLFYCDFTVL